MLNEEDHIFREHSICLDNGSLVILDKCSQKNWGVSLGIERVLSEKVAEPQPGLWSNCLKFGNQVFLSGLVALEGETIIAKGDSHGQAVYIFEAIQHYLTQAGGTMSDVVTLNIFVTSMRYRPGVLDARRLGGAGSPIARRR